MKDIRISQICYIQSYHTCGIVTGDNIDWHAKTQATLYSTQNLASCDFIHFPDLIQGHISFVKNDNVTGVSLNDVVIVDPRYPMIDWDPSPLKNVSHLKSTIFQSNLLKLLYEDINEMENEMSLLDDEIDHLKDTMDKHKETFANDLQVLFCFCFCWKFPNIFLNNIL